ncbi:MAG: HisA/HisF-related TIM barrel protein [Planctomycetota bacterium]|nr:HisA/HisF-related TIM barrel protein [Planctomycetota bacterium]
MVLTRVIPCLDVSNGRVVKGVRFQGLRDAGDPVECARRYEEQGADELCLLDVSATPEGRGNALETVAAVRAALGIPLTVGGGVRVLDDAERLLSAGADKVTVNSAAVERPGLLTEINARLGAQCTVLALDAARHDAADPASGWEVTVQGGRTRTGRDAIRWAIDGVAAGAGEILATSWDRDGTGDGYDTELLGALAAAVRVPIIASGGARTPAHMRTALDAGASAVLAASIFHDAETTVGEVKRGLASLGVPVRLDLQPGTRP